MVGLTGFEPATPTTPRWCATKLRYSPTLYLLNFQLIRRSLVYLIPLFHASRKTCATARHYTY